MAIDKVARPQPRRRGSRRHDVLRALVLVPLLWPLVAMLERMRARQQPSTFALPADLPYGLSVTAQAIVHRSADGAVQAYAARCTHLGCRLDRVVDGVVVCPCHGSRYDAEGQVLAGPATRALQRLRVTPDTQTGGWSVDAG